MILRIHVQDGRLWLGIGGERLFEVHTDPLTSRIWQAFQSRNMIICGLDIGYNSVESVPFRFRDDIMYGVHFFRCRRIGVVSWDQARGVRLLLRLLYGSVNNC